MAQVIGPLAPMWEPWIELAALALACPAFMGTWGLNQLMGLCYHFCSLTQI